MLASRKSIRVMIDVAAPIIVLPVSNPTKRRKHVGYHKRDRFLVVDLGEFRMRSVKLDQGNGATNPTIDSASATTSAQKQFESVHTPEQKQVEDTTFSAQSQGKEASTSAQSQAKEEPISAQSQGKEEPISAQSQAKEEPISAQSQAKEEPISAQSQAKEEPISAQSQEKEAPISTKDQVEEVSSQETEVSADDEFFDAMDGTDQLDDNEDEAATESGGDKMEELRNDDVVIQDSNLLKPDGSHDTVDFVDASSLNDQSNTELLASQVREPCSANTDQGQAKQHSVNSDSVEDLGALNAIEKRLEALNTMSKDGNKEITHYDTWEISLSSASVFLFESQLDQQNMPQFFANLTSKSVDDTFESRRTYRHVVNHIDVSILLQTSMLPKEVQVARTQTAVTMQTLRVHLAPVLFDSLDALVDSFSSLEWATQNNSDIKRSLSSATQYQSSSRSHAGSVTSRNIATLEDSKGSLYMNTKFNMAGLEVLVSSPAAGTGTQTSFEVSPILLGNAENLEVRLQQRKRSIHTSMNLQRVQVQDLLSPNLPDGSVPTVISSTRSLASIVPTSNQLPQCLDDDSTCDVIRVNVDVLYGSKERKSTKLNASFEFNTLHVEWVPETIIAVSEAFTPPTHGSLTPVQKETGENLSMRQRRSSSARNLLHGSSFASVLSASPGSTSGTLSHDNGGIVTSASDDQSEGTRTVEASVTMSLRSFSVALNKQHRSVDSTNQTHSVKQRQLVLVAMHDTSLRFDQSATTFKLAGDLGNLHCMVPVVHQRGQDVQYIDMFTSTFTSEKLLRFEYNEFGKGTESTESVGEDAFDAKLWVEVSSSLLVYSQQTTLEFVDYLEQGVLGALPNVGQQQGETVQPVEHSAQENDTGTSSSRIQLAITLNNLELVLPRKMEALSKHDIHSESIVAKCQTVSVSSNYIKSKLGWDSVISVETSKLVLGTRSMTNENTYDDNHIENIMNDPVDLVLTLTQPLDNYKANAQDVEATCEVSVSDIQLILSRDQYFVINGVLNDNIFSEVSTIELDRVNGEPSTLGYPQSSVVEYFYDRTDKPALTFDIQVHFHTASLMVSCNNASIAMFSLRKSLIRFCRVGSEPVSIHWSVRAMDLVDMRPCSDDRFYKHLILSNPQPDTNLGGGTQHKNAFTLHFIPETRNISITLTEFTSIFMLDLFMQVLDFVLTTEPQHDSSLSLPRDVHHTLELRNQRNLVSRKSDSETKSTNVVGEEEPGWVGEFNLIGSQLCFSDSLKDQDAKLLALRGDIGILWNSNASGTRTCWNVTCTSLEAFGKSPKLTEPHATELSLEQQVLLFGNPTHQVVEPTSFTIEYIYEIESRLAKIDSRQLRVECNQTEVFLSLSDIATIRKVVEMLNEQQIQEDARQKAELGMDGVEFGSESHSSAKWSLYDTSRGALQNRVDDGTKEVLNSPQQQQPNKLISSTRLAAMGKKGIKSLAMKAKVGSTATASKLKGKIARATSSLPFRSQSSLGTSSNKKRWSDGSIEAPIGVARRNSTQTTNRKDSQERRSNNEERMSSAAAKRDPLTIEPFEVPDEMSFGTVHSIAQLGRLFCDHTHIEVECLNVNDGRDLGITFSQIHGYVTVASMETDPLSPRILHQSPVRVGDVLTKVNGTYILSENLESVEELLVGSFSLTFHKFESEEPLILKDTIDVSSGLLVIYLIDDNESKDFPVAHLNFPKIDAFMNGSTVGNYVFGMQLVMAMHYYSAITAQWELLMSPWETNISCTLFQNGNIDFVVGATNALSFHLPDSFLATVYGVLNEDAPQRESGTKEKKSTTESSISRAQKGIQKLLSTKSLMDQRDVDVALPTQTGTSATSTRAKAVLEELLQSDNDDESTLLTVNDKTSLKGSNDTILAPFMVHNYTGVEVVLEKIGIDSARDPIRFITVPDSATRSYGFSHEKGAGTAVLRTYNKPKCVSLELDGGLWEPVHSQQVNRVGGGKIVLNPRPKPGPKFRVTGTVVVPAPKSGFGFTSSSSDVIIRSVEQLPKNPEFKFEILGSAQPGNRLSSPAIVAEKVTVSQVSFQTKYNHAQDDHSFSVKVHFGGTPCPVDGIVIAWQAQPSSYPCHQGVVMQHMEIQPLASTSIRREPLPALPPLNVWWEVSLEGRRLALTLSSLVKVYNNTSTPLSVLVNSPHWTDGPVEIPTHVAPGQVCHVPVLLGDASELRFRPVGGAVRAGGRSLYGWSQTVYKSLGQHQGISRVECQPLENGAAHSSCHMHVQVKRCHDGERVQFNVFPSITLRNLLPIPVVVDQLFGKQRVAQSHIHAGDDIQSLALPASSAHAKLSLKLAGDTQSAWSKVVGFPDIIKKSRRGATSSSDDSDVLPGLTLLMHSQEDDDSVLVRLQHEVGRAEGIIIVIYSPCWIVNRTMLPLRFRSKPANGDAPGPWVDPIGICRAPGGILMFAPNQDRMQFSVADSPPGKAFYVDKPGISGCITVPHGEVLETNYDIGVAVDIGPGMLYRTNLVTLVPRYVLLNRTALAQDNTQQTNHFVGKGSMAGTSSPSAEDTRESLGLYGVQESSNSLLSESNMRQAHRVAIRFAGMEEELLVVPQGDCVPFWGAPNIARTGTRKIDKRIAKTLKQPYAVQIRITPSTIWSDTFTFESLLSQRSARVFKLENVGNPYVIHRLQVEVRAGDAAASVCVEFKELSPILPTIPASPRSNRVSPAASPRSAPDWEQLDANFAAQSRLTGAGTSSSATMVDSSEGRSESQIQDGDEPEASWAQVPDTVSPNSNMVVSPRASLHNELLQQYSSADTKKRSIRFQVPLISLKLLETDKESLVNRNVPPTKDIASVSMFGLYVSLKSTACGTVDQVDTLGISVDELLLQDLSTSSQFKVVAHGKSNSTTNSSPSSKDTAFLRTLVVSRFHPTNYVFEKLKVAVGQLVLQLDERFLVLLVDKYRFITMASQELKKNLSKATTARLTVEQIQQQAREEVAVAYLGSPETQELAKHNKNSLYFRDLYLADLPVKLSYQQHPNPTNSNKLYDLGGGLLSRMKIRVDGAKFKLDRFVGNHLFLSPSLLFSSLTHHYQSQVKSQMVDVLRSVNIRGTDWGITSTLMKTFVGEEVVSEEFAPESMSNGEIVAKYRKRLPTLGSLDQFLSVISNLVFDWRYNHRGLNSRRCIIVGIVNRSNVDIRFEPVLLQGSGCHSILAARPKVTHTSLLSREEQLVLQPWQGVWKPECCGLILSYGFLSDKVDLRIVSRGFKARFHDVNVAMSSNAHFSSSFLHKDSNSWYSSYVIVVDNNVV